MSAPSWMSEHVATPMLLSHDERASTMHLSSRVCSHRENAMFFQGLPRRCCFIFAALMYQRLSGSYRNFSLMSSTAHLISLQIEGDATVGVGDVVLGPPCRDAPAVDQNKE